MLISIFEKWMKGREIEGRDLLTGPQKMIQPVGKPPEVQD
jgi:hypothetical protein